MLACVRLADKDGRVVLVCVRLVEEDSGFSGWQRPGPCRVGPRFQRSSSTSARRVQQNTGTQLLVEILQERKKAGGAIQGGHGLVDGIAGREDERPLPERLAAPGTVPCRVPFLAFLIHYIVLCSPQCWRRTELTPWRSTMEVEERNCSMASNSCDLTLYVGYILRSLRSSLDAVESGQVFAESLGE